MKLIHIINMKTICGRTFDGIIINHHDMHHDDAKKNAYMELKQRQPELFRTKEEK